jgi:hypothetical protein
MRWNSIGNSADGLAEVLFGQFEHRILDDVQRGVLVLDRKHRLFECSTLHLGEKRRDFLVGGQFSLPGTVASLDYKHRAAPEYRATGPKTLTKTR